MGTHYNEHSYSELLHSIVKKLRGPSECSCTKLQLAIVNDRVKNLVSPGIRYNVIPHLYSIYVYVCSHSTYINNKEPAEYIG